jgi:hypothetical protein
MSSFIVVEALALVTWWGLGRLVFGLRRRVGHPGRRGGVGGGAPVLVYDGTEGHSDTGDKVRSA